MKKKIFVRGPVLSQSGYGEQSRFALRALMSREDIFDIYIQPIPWGHTGWIWEQSSFREWMDSKIAITQVLLQQKNLQPDISLQVTIPNEFQQMCPVNIGYTAGIETTKVSPAWLQKGNEMNKVLVVSNHAKDSYVNTVFAAKDQSTGKTVEYQLETPVEVVWETTPREEPEKIDGISLDYDFNFLMISQFGPRKNFENAVKWWIEEFIDQEVGLVLKTNLKNNSITDWDYLQKNINNMVENYPDRKCKVYLLHGDLSSGQMTWLYNNPKIKALVNIAHGEGFGLPMFEASREALPIITVGWSGQKDFLTHDDKEYYQKVDHSLQPISERAVWDGVLEKDSMWAYADQGSYKMGLRKLFKSWDDAKEKAVELQKINSDKFSDEKLYKLFVDSVLGFDSSLISSEEGEGVLEFE